MRYARINLLDDVVSVYDQNKTTITGRALQQVVNGYDCLGPRLTKFIDVFTDTGLAPGIPHVTPNGRMFIVTAPSAGLASILLYNFNLSTGSYSYAGRVQFNLPNLAATTHTLRALKVVDAGTSGWKVFVATTGSVLINGGLFLINNLALSDFVPIGFPTLGFGAGSDQKAVYFLQDPAFLGAAHQATASVGLALDLAGSSIHLHNGVSATHQFRCWNYSTAPNNPGQTATISIASPGVITSAGHGYAAGDQVVLTTTGALPTGLTAGTTYFVRNPTANTFELSITTGGAGINTSGTQSGVHTVRRAFGIASNLSMFATGNLPALTGTLLAVGAEYLATPPTGPNAGVANLFFATSSQIYQGKASELSAGVTTWPSLSTANTLGAPSEFTAPTLTNFVYSSVLDRYIYVTNVAQFVSKKWINNQIEKVFGGVGIDYWEGKNPETVNLETAAVSYIDAESGWLFVSNLSTAGQRGIFVLDYRSDYEFDYSAVISKVHDLDNGILRFIATIEALFESTGNLHFFYRTSGFGSASGGWNEFVQGQDLAPLAGAQIQFKFLFDIANLDASTPAQLIAFLFGYDQIGSTSDKWLFSRDLTSTSSPARTAFVQQKAYGIAVPKLTLRAYNRTTGTLVLEKNTEDHPSEFEYSSNNGSTWNALGTIPDGALTTAVRYNWSSPPGVDVIVGLSDE